MVLEAALKECGADCTRDSLAEALLKINVQTAGIYPDPVRWTKDSHIREASFTAYVWDPATQSVKRITDWSRVKAGDLANVKMR